MADREEAALAAGVGLVVVRHGAVAWFNDAARDLVVPRRWCVERPGLRRSVSSRACDPIRAAYPLRWPSPSDPIPGGGRSTPVRSVGERTLYQISDETDRYDADGRDTGPMAAQ